MTTNMKLKIDNYVITPCKFIAGTRGSYGIEPIELELSQEWNDLAVTISFYPVGTDPVSLVYNGEPFYIPSEVMNRSGSCKYVVSGVRDEKTLVTAEGLIRVLSTGTPTTKLAESPTPSIYAQILAAMEGKAQSNHTHTEYAPKQGYAKGLTAGLADNLVSPIYGEYEGPISRHKVNGGRPDMEVARAVVDRIKGMSVMQTLSNGNFESQGSWDSANGSLEIADNTASMAIDLTHNTVLYYCYFSTASGGDPIDLPFSLNEYYLFFDDEPMCTQLVQNTSKGCWQLVNYGEDEAFVRVSRVGESEDDYFLELQYCFFDDGVNAVLSNSCTLVPGHKYYIAADIESPSVAGGIALIYSDSSGNPVRLGKTGGKSFERVSGLLDATSASGTLSIFDERTVGVELSGTGSSSFLGCHLKQAGLFVSGVGALGPEDNGEYVFSYNSTYDNWDLLTPSGKTIKRSPGQCGITAVFDEDEDPTGCVIRAQLDMPFIIDADVIAAPKAGTTGITIDYVDAKKYISTMGATVVRGNTYEFTYMSGRWSVNGRGFESLEAVGIYSTISGTLQNNDKITVRCRVKRENFRVRNVQICDLSVMGMTEYTKKELDGILVGYNTPGVGSVNVGGMVCCGSDGTELCERTLLTQNYELCRLPNGVYDELNLSEGRLIRRVGKQAISGSSGDLVTLAGAKNGTVFIGMNGAVPGSIVGSKLLLSGSVNETVLYELDTPVITTIDEPDSFAVKRGGEEMLIYYNGFALDYANTSVGGIGKLGYMADLATQIETDRVWLYALLDALGVLDACDEEISQLSDTIKNALES